MKKKLNTLSQRIVAGYGALVLVIAVAVIFTLFQVKSVNDIAVRVTDQRVPTTKTCLEITNGVNHSIAALRGWILLRDPGMKAEREEAWNNEIEAPLKILKELYKRRPDSITKANLDELEIQLEQLQNYQAKAEAIADSDTAEAIKQLQTNGLETVSRIRLHLDAIMTEVEASMRADFTNMDHEISLLKNLEWTFLAIGIILSITLGIIIARSITRPVNSAVEVAENIAAGDLETQVNITGSRELARLGEALLQMRNALKQRADESQKHAWHAIGQNKLNEVLRGDKSVQELADDIIEFMAEYTRSSIGALALSNGTTELFIAGKYAFKANGDNGTIKMGEGLIGQAAASKKSQLLENLDAADIKITSSIVDTAPSHIYVAPFTHEDHALGVIELGRLEPFNEALQTFIEASMESIAIAMSSAISRKKINELLEETQRQSEELQAQQEELQQTNEELEEQTQKLKEQQEELQAANEELEEQAQIVEQKNKDLENARQDIELKAKQLEISSKYKSEFLANMSHELRTPLNSLLILSNDLSENRDGNLTDDQVESAQVIAKSGQDLLSLINEILDLSKIEAGRMDFNAEEFPISDIAETIKRSFKATAKEKGINFKVEVHEDLPDTITSDRQRLEQILKNLVSNALKFTDKGQVSVDFHRDAGDRLQVAVSDTGIGIPKEKQQIIFEAFQQADGSTARKYGGTGLGLSISRELARFLDGKILISSTPGKGSVFKLIIPLTGNGEEKPKPLADKPKASAPKFPKVEHSKFLNYPSLPDNRKELNKDDHVILIVEDDRHFAQILANQAQQKGFKYLAAATGEDGLELAEKFLPQAIILDIDLPGMNGYAVLKTLKSNPGLRHIPVHIMSVGEKTLDPIKEGAVEYLTKPVSKNQLEEAFARIEDFINRKMKNLLILEDDKNLRKSIVKLIGNGDVHCYEAGTAAEAVKIFKNHTIDCMVLDIGLPDINGFELLKKLEKEEKLKLPPVIVYTGKELSRKENDELQEYAETIIVKGVKSEERLLDETALFLHRMVKNLPTTKQQMIAHLYNQDTLFAGKKILVVDDDMRNVWALSKVLTNKGLEVVKAENGKVALEKLAQDKHIDMVISDIMMPEMDGYEFMRNVREQQRYRELPIIALTAKAMKEDRQLCIEAGANDYITKPVDVERLISLIHIWIKK